MLKQRLELKLQNKLVLTVSLKQQLALLLLPKVELQETVKTELEENPFLEEITNLQPEFEPVKDYAKYYDEEEKPVTSRLAYKPSLTDMLEFQIDIEFEGEEKDIAYEIIGDIDEKGFLTVPVEDIAEKLHMPVQHVENVRQKVMRLEPTGIGAKDIKEALKVQYEELFGEDELADRIISENLELVCKPEKLFELYKDIPVERLQEIICNIKSLKPYPAINYLDEPVRYVEPDVYVYDRGDRFEIVVNESEIPRLKLTTAYRKLISDKTLPEETRKFLEDKLQRAIGIIKGIEQRRENLYKITEFLVNYQSEFIRKGREYLKPLILKDVAEVVGLHESTVSRIVSSKYVQLPTGLLPLKAFFSTKLSSSSGDISTEKVKYMIAELIEKEDKRKPLSDQKIADILKSKGINVARRTVTKYREQLNIPDSRNRRIKK
ncbi:RNA polymerase, sigma 54 subunit, RpoN/SigL [Persephonella hydrogeniphila]|uniref:RNA polymerase, sigma 54 subunit, RpoN/SigL n=1 Tax=Persephonella hydrogeniphila TaxID=198703 RepID=A0A285NEM2_9AQUI|nr:RNA polymerase factor sigma-54 [Persephonella hydrogeniphila]SNZ07952.1 RNA polymerase, sigma 54 subunit, RpoN/SigL [Persephonella hydrogeniphila]